MLWSKSDDWYLYDPLAKSETLIGPVAANPRETVEKLAALSASVGNRFPILVLLSASDVLFSSFDGSEVNHSRNRQTLSYHLESELPLSAEETLADFHFSGDRRSGHIAALACAENRLRPLVDALQVAGFQIAGISASSLVIAQRLLSEKKLLTPTFLIFESLQDQPRFEILRAEAGSITDWRIANDMHSLVATIRMLSPNQPMQLCALTITDSQENQEGDHDSNWLDAFRQTLPESELVLEIPDRQSYEAAAVTDMVSGRMKPWFDLSRDRRCFAEDGNARASRAKAILAAAAFCMLIAAGACAWRIQRIENSIDDLQALQREIFREVLPGQRPPAAVLTRLRSEYTKLAGSRKLTGNAVPKPAEAIPVLRDLLEALPRPLQFEVNEVRIEGNEIFLELTLQEHRDAAELAEALQTKGFALSPPTTESFDGGVRASLRGSLGSDAG